MVECEVVIMKTKGPRSDALRKDLSRLIGGEKVKTEPENLLAYSSNATRYYAQGKPEAVVLAASVDNVSKVVKYASDYEIPGVTPRGAASGLSGGATPCTAGSYWIPSV